MRCFCPYSGNHYFADDTFKEENECVYPHPIFSLSGRSLLARARKWGKSQYSIEEEKLLFLALLNKTGSVSWETPANPHSATVKKYLEPLFKLIIWYNEVDSSTLKLPHIRISQYHNDLSNIGSFISAVYEVRKEWMEPAIRRIQDQLLEVREQRLYKLIHSRKTTEEYAKQLADYAVIAAQIPENKIDIWTEIITTPLDHSIFTLDPSEVSLLINWIHKHLYKGSGSIHSAKLLEHVNKLYSIQKEGMLTYLGGELKVDPRSTFQIKIDDMGDEDREEQVASLKELEDRLSASGAPSEEPIRGKYLSLLQWAKDMAKWRTTEKLREDISYAKARGL